MPVVTITPSAGPQRVLASNTTLHSVALLGIGNRDTAGTEAIRPPSSTPAAAGEGRYAEISALAEALLGPGTAAGLQVAPASGETASNAEATDSGGIRAAEIRRGMRPPSRISPKASPIRRRPSFNVRRVVAHMGARHRHRTLNRQQNASWQRKEPAKESVSVSKQGPRAMDRVHPSRMTNRRPDDPQSGPKASPAPVLPKTPPPAPAAGASTGTAVPAAATGLAPACLSVAGTVQTMRDMLQLRNARRNLPFCVDADSASVLSGTFTYRRHQTVTPALTQPVTHLQAPWMVLHLQPQTLEAPMARLHIHKYPDVAAMSDNRPVPAEPLRADALLSALTLSALPAAELDAQGIATQRILPRNSFKLVQHRELGGTVHTHLAWFVHRPQAGGVVIKAGFLPLHFAPASYKVHDAQTGMSFESDNLVDFVNGLERVSGTTLRVDADTPLGMMAPRRTDADIPLLPVDNLYVRLEAAQPDSSMDVIHPAMHVGFFDATRFSLPDRGAAGWLYRNSFVVKGDRLLYRDLSGNQGTLSMRVADSDVRRFRLLPHLGHEAAFIREHGLHPDQAYTHQDLIGSLQNYGLLWLPADEDEPLADSPGLEMFQPRLPTPGPTQERRP